MGNDTNQRGGDHKQHVKAGQAGGNATASTHGSDFYQEIGSKGGSAAQKSGHAHQLTEEDRSEGGSNSGGNFKNDPQRASEAGKKGGQS